MRNILLIVSLLCLAPNLLSAQFGSWGGKKGKTIKGKITGVLLDSITNQPVSYATISVSKAGKSSIIDGVLSEDDGKFTSNLKNGAYDLKISFLGYEEKVLTNVELTLKDPDNDLGTVLLSPSAVVLDAIEIKEERSLIENKVDRLVFNAENDASISGGDATEVLRKVPLLSVDLDGNVSLRGSQQVQILINGKPSGMFSSNPADALKMFPADQIKKVEVITAPSAKYDGEGSAGIINIITKRDQLEGIAGSVDASLGNRQNSTFLNLNAGKGRLGFSSNGAVFYSIPQDGSTGFYRYDLTGPAEVLTISNEGTTRSSRLGFNGSASAFYDFNAYNAINSSFSARGFTFNNDGFVEGFSELDLFTGRDDFRRETEGDNLNTGYDWSTDYTRTFEDNDTKEWSIAYQLSGNLQNTSNFLDEVHTVDFLNRNGSIVNDGDNTEHTLQTDLVWPVGNGKKIETGIKGVLRGINSDADFNFGSNENTNYQYDQDVYAAYMVYSFAFAKLNFNAGIRYEATDINGNFQRNTLSQEELPVDQHYDNWLPSITVSKSLSNFRTLKTSYTKRIQRPSLRFINPFNNNTDIFNIQIGNPLLEPEIVHQTDLSYNFNVKGFMVFSSVFWRHTDDIIESIIVQNEEGQSINTFDNVGTNNAYGLNLFTSKTINKLTVRAGGNANIYDGTGIVNGEELSQTALQYNLFFNGDYKISGTFKADFFGFFRAPRQTLQGTNPSFSIYGIGIRKEFDKYSLGLRLIEPHTPTKSFDTDLVGADGTFRQESFFEIPFRSIGVNFKYKFGKVDFKERKSKIKNTDLKAGGDDGQGGAVGGAGGGSGRGR